MVIIGGDAIRTGSVLLIIIYHAIPLPLALIGTLRVNGSSRGRGRQRGGRVTWGHVADAAPQVAGWGRLRPFSWVAWRPVATPVGRRRRVVFPFVVSGSALGNLNMDAFPLKFSVVQSLYGIHGLIRV